MKWRTTINKWEDLCPMCLKIVYDSIKGVLDDKFERADKDSTTS